MKSGIAFVVAMMLALGSLVGLSVAPSYAADSADPAVISEAREQYLKAICPANANRERFAKVALKAIDRGWSDGDKPTKAMRKASRKASRAEARAARQLARYTWPEDIAADVKVMAETGYLWASFFGKIASGSRNPTAPPAISDTVARVRLALGLGAANTESDGC